MTSKKNGQSRYVQKTMRHDGATSLLGHDIRETDLRRLVALLRLSSASSADHPAARAVATVRLDLLSDIVVPQKMSVVIEPTAVDGARGECLVLSSHVVGTLALLLHCYFISPSPGSVVMLFLYEVL